MVLNAESITNKINELSLLIDATSPDLIIITESHCNSTISDALISIKGFTLTRADRVTGRKGGVVLLSRSDFFITNIVIKSHQSGSWEGLSCDLQISKTTSLRVCGVYRSPGKLPDNAAADLLSFLQDACSPKKSHFLLCGDFNFPTVNWETYTATGSTLASDFLDFLLNASLTQHVNFPTRYRGINRPSILDLVITDSNNNITHIGSSPPLGKSDHIVILFDLALYPASTISSTDHFNYSKADFVLVNDMIACIDWEEELSGLTAAEAFDVLDRFLRDIRCCYIPVYSRTSKSRPKWLNRPTKTAINRKKRAWDKYKKNPSPASYSTYATARADASSTIFLAKQTYEKKLLHASAKNPKQLFSYVNRQQASKSPIAIQAQTGLLTAPQDVATELNVYFQSVFQKPSYPFKAPPPQKGPLNSTINISSYVVYQHLIALNIATSPGPSPSISS